MDQIDIRKSLIIAGICISAAIIVGQGISSYTYIKTITSLVEPKQITVTGTAEKAVKSDLAVWSGTISREGKGIKEQREKLAEDISTVKKYFLSCGVKENEISAGLVKLGQAYKKDVDGRELDDKSEDYDLAQTIEIKSGNIDKVAEISLESEAIIDLGVQFEADPAKYFRTKPENDLKLETYALATENARAMARGLAKKNGNKLGSLSSIETGAFRIISADSPTPYEESADNTTSINKKAVATVTAVFEVK